MYRSLLDSQLNQEYYSYCHGEGKGKLERLFGEEREFARNDYCSTAGVPIVLLNSSSSPSSSTLSLCSGERRERVGNEAKEEREGETCGGIAVEKWKFQAEMLRAECNFLRKERELALRKLEKNKVQMQRALRSAVETLISGRKKIFEGKNVNAVLEAEIEDLAEKLEVLHRNSGIKDNEFKKCSRNFDKQVCHLQRRLEKLGGLSDDQRAQEFQELMESRVNMNMNMNQEIDKQSSVSDPRNHNKSTDTELLRKKMEGLSKETWDRLEEDFGLMLSNTAHSSASTSTRIEYPLEYPVYQQEEGKCSGRCKAIVRNILEQVRVETEQWSQMQVMLGKVREEMEELEASREFWEDQALNSDSEIKRLQTSVQEWKEKALSLEIKTDELQKELAAIRGDLDRLKTAEVNENSRETSIIKRHGIEIHRAFHQLKENHQNHVDDRECKDRKVNLTTEVADFETALSADVQPISLGKQLQKEKRLLLHRMKEKHQAQQGKAKDISSKKSESDCRKLAMASTWNSSSGVGNVKRSSPLHDITNSSPLMKQSSRAIFPLL